MVPSGPPPDRRLDEIDQIMSGAAGQVEATPA
jgi:hypothetical protein